MQPGMELFRSSGLAAIQEQYNEEHEDDEEVIVDEDNVQCAQDDPAAGPEVVEVVEDEDH